VRPAIGFLSAYEEPRSGGALSLFW